MWKVDRTSRVFDIFVKATRESGRLLGSRTVSLPCGDENSWLRFFEAPTASARDPRASASGRLILAAKAGVVCAALLAGEGAYCQTGIGTARCSSLSLGASTLPNGTAEHGRDQLKGPRVDANGKVSIECGFEQRR